MPRPLAASTHSLRAAGAAGARARASAGRWAAPEPGCAPWGQEPQATGGPDSLDAVDSGGDLSIAPPSRHIDRPRTEAQPTAPTRRVLRRERAARHIDRIAR